MVQHSQLCYILRMIKENLGAPASKEKGGSKEALFPPLCHSYKSLLIAKLGLSIP